MADTLTDQMTYVDNGKLILKKSWWDPDTGETWDTFDDSGDAPTAAPQGSTVDSGGANETPFDAGQSYGPSYSPTVGRTVGAPAPQSSGYATPAASQVAQNNPAAGTGAPTQGFGTPTSGGAPSDPEYFRQKTLYDYANPGFALQNAMLGLGYNPFTRGSAFAQGIQRMAPGLGQAYLMSQAGKGLTPADVAQGPNQFQQFLQNALRGGNVVGTLQGAAAGLPNAINAVRDYDQRLMNGESMVNANPYLTELANNLSAGLGQGTTNFLAATLGPMMSQQMLSGYQGNLQNSLFNAIRGQTGQQNFGRPGEEDIWRYLLRI